MTQQLALDVDPRVQIVVDDRIRITTRGIPPQVLDDLKHAFTHANPARAKLEKMGIKGFALHKEPKTISTYNVERDVLTVPRGGMGRVRAILDRAGLVRNVLDARCAGDPQLAGKIPPHRFELYDFQNEIVDAILRFENGFVRAPTGSGKTVGGLAVASRINLPTLIVVHNTGLLKQWLGAIGKQLGLAGADVGVIGGGTFRVRPLTVAMQQTLKEERVLKQVRHTFGLLICDELQTAAAKTFLATYDQFPARYRLGMSANERSRDKKQFLIYDLFGDRALVDVDQDELIDRGVVLDVEVCVALSEFRAPFYDEFKARLREAEIVAAKTGEALPRSVVDERMRIFDRLLEAMMIDPARQQLIAEIARDEVNAGERVLLLSHRREHCARNDADVSALGIRVGRMVGGAEDRAEFDRAKDGLTSGELRVVAGTYHAIGTGIDLPAVAVGICTTPIAGSKDGKPFYQQVRGRLCRRADGKTGARIWYVLDREVFGLEPLRNLLRWNRNVRVRDMIGAWHDGKTWLDENREG